MDNPLDESGNAAGATFSDSPVLPGASQTSRFAAVLGGSTNDSDLTDADIGVSDDPEEPTDNDSDLQVGTGSGSDVSLEPADDPAPGGGVVIGVGNLTPGEGSDILIPLVKDTLAFSESKNRWVTFYSFEPDYMGTNNIDFVSYKDGQLYIHNENSTYNNFYGLQFSSLIEFLSNIEPSSNKMYNHIFSESTHVFAMPLATNQYGQKSSLIESDFTEFEGVWKAAFLRDENTPNVTNPLIEGDTMRCHSMNILLENKDTGLVTLFAVGIGVELSELTDK